MQEAAWATKGPAEPGGRQASLITDGRRGIASGPGSSERFRHPGCPLHREEADRVRAGRRRFAREHLPTRSGLEWRRQPGARVVDARAAIGSGQRHAYPSGVTSEGSPSGIGRDDPLRRSAPVGMVGADLMVTSRLSAILGHHGLSLRSIAHGADLSGLQLVLVDLNRDQESRLQTMRGLSQVTPPPLIVAFGPHVLMRDLGRRARAAGADRVVANSALPVVLEGLLARAEDPARSTRSTHD